MNRSEKAELIETLQSTLNASTTVVVAHQVGMTVAESGDLRGKIVGLLQAPASKLARVTQAPAGKLARVVKAREEQLQQGS